MFMSVQHTSSHKFVTSLLLAAVVAEHAKCFFVVLSALLLFHCYHTHEYPVEFPVHIHVIVWHTREIRYTASIYQCCSILFVF